MFQLRDYQQGAVDAVFNYFETHGSQSGNPLIKMPTGTGKSLVIAGILKRVATNWGNCRTMVITHVKELVEQNHDKMVKLWPEAPTGIFSAGMGRKDKYSMITFAGIQSVAKQARYFKDVQLILVDEADLISANQQTSYQKFFAEIRERNPYLKIIGLTATDWRLGYGSIVKQNEDELCIFDKVVFDACTVECFNWFIKEGYLLPVVPKHTKLELDVTGVKKSGGDYQLGELQKAVNKPSLTKKILESSVAVMQEQHRQSMLLFCSGVDHATDVARQLCEMGVECKVVTGDTPTGERDRIIADFKTGKLPAVANNNVLTTGFDHPGLDLIVMLRPSQSSRLWVQMLGRGTRPCYADGFDLTTTVGRLAAIASSHKQNCLVLDFSGNTGKLGPINDPVVPKRPGEKKGGDCPSKLCPVCDSWNHASVRYCGGAPAPDQMAGYCGNEFVFETKLQVTSSSKKLVKDDLPVTEIYTVELVSYYAHQNRGDRTKPQTLRVDYHIDTGRTISQWICLFHDGFAGNKARRWWREHCNLPVPSNIDEALNVASGLRIPTHIYVDIGKKFPEVLSCCYDGTAFGKQQSTGVVPTAHVMTAEKILAQAVQERAPSYQDFDGDGPSHPMPSTTPVDFDDIPF